MEGNGEYNINNLALFAELVAVDVSAPRQPKRLKPKGFGTLPTEKAAGRYTGGKPIAGIQSVTHADLDNAAITQLVSEWARGNTDARDSLFPIIYERLRLLARSQISRAATLQPTALVNEAFIKLDQSGWEIENRRHFFALAAQVMRQVLVSHARAAARQKRGGDQVRMTLNDEVAASQPVDVDIIQLDDSLRKLEAFNARAARALELSYFGGFDHSSVAAELDVSLRTIERELRFGRAWLKARLQAS